MKDVERCQLVRQSCGFYTEDTNGEGFAETSYCHKYGKFVRYCGGFEPVPDIEIIKAEQRLKAAQHICEMAIDNNSTIDHNETVLLESAIGSARYVINHILAERENADEENKAKTCLDAEKGAGNKR